jgi:hypothetical protein
MVGPLLADRGEEAEVADQPAHHQLREQRGDVTEMQRLCGERYQDEQAGPGGLTKDGVC